ncbi:MAG: hypothetical protein Q6J33_05210, partial [Gloeomargarita sp. DG_2_bins_126]
MAADAPVWLTQVCPWQAAVWQKILASQNLAVQWQSTGDWQRSWSTPPRLWLLDVAVSDADVGTYCEWWRNHEPGVPLGLIDSRQKRVSEAQQFQVQQWGVLGLLPGFDREHLTRSVAANLRQVLTWLGAGDLDKARLVPVLVSLPQLTEDGAAPDTHPQEPPPPAQPVQPVPRVVRRYRGAEITAVPDPSPPPAQAERRYRGVKITPSPSRAPEQPQGGEMAAVSVPSQADVLKPPPPPKPRNLLGGRYQIMYPLGVGGFCQTLLAMDRQRPGHPRCVVKQLRPSHKHAQHLAIARRLFCAEAETLEKLGQHPQIPRLLAYFEEREQFF